MPLQNELKKKEPFDSLEQEVMLNLLRTNDLVQIEFTRLFRDHGLMSSSQYNILRILRGEGAPMTTLDIAKRTITVVPGITGLVDRLQEKGLVSRRRCGNDRRRVYVEITSEGLSLLARLDQPLLNLHKEVAQHLTKAELVQLKELLEKIRQRCPLGKRL
ncbi:MAG: MarR family winged helix-turn-helix transcriptional regulator [Gemmataceae bacterium]